jgi:hypothetical protein
MKDHGLAVHTERQLRGKHVIKVLLLVVTDISLACAPCTQPASAH